MRSKTICKQVVNGRITKYHFCENVQKGDNIFTLGLGIVRDR